MINEIYSSKERQRELLEKEGLTIKKETNGDSYYVDSYKVHRFDFKKLKISILSTDEQIAKKLGVY